MIEWAAVLGGGLLSSAHCVGMCGGFATAIGATQQSIALSLMRHAAYTVGRITTYAFLGALAGYAGLRISASNWASAQRIFSLTAGALMVLIGASALGLLRLPKFRAFGMGELFAPAFRYFLNARDNTGFFLAGLANGFLPCGLVYAFLLHAMARTNLVDGALTMIAFGLGTAPVMMAMGCGGMLLNVAARKRLVSAAACLVMVMGMITMGRGWQSDGQESCCPEADGSAAPFLTQAGR